MCDFPVNEFDKIARVMLTQPNTDDFYMAHNQLQELSKRNDIWKLVIPIFAQSSFSYSKYLICCFFKDFISHKWCLIPVHHRENLKMFFFSLILDLEMNFNIGSNNYSNENGSDITLMIAIDSTFLEIIKIEWPDNWSNLIYELISQSKVLVSSNPQRYLRTSCFNVLSLFELLSNEIHRSTYHRIFTSDRLKELEDQLDNDSTIILSFIADILSSDYNEEFSFLKIQALKTVASFLIWIDPIKIGTIFIPPIISSLFGFHIFRPHILNCFSAISSSSKLTDNSLNLGKFIEGTFLLLIGQINAWLKSETSQATDNSFNLNLANLSEEETHALSVTISNFLMFQDFRLIALFTLTMSHQSPVMFALNLMLNLTEITNDSSFEICLEFWENLSVKALTSQPTIRMPEELTGNLQIILSKRISPEYKNQITSILQNTSKFYRGMLINWILEKITTIPPNDERLLLISLSASALIGSIENHEEENQFVTLLFNTFLPNFDSSDVVKISVMNILVATNRFFFLNPQLFFHVITKIFETTIHPNSNIQEVSVNTFETLCQRFHILFENQADFVSNLMNNFNNGIVHNIPDTFLSVLYKSLSLGIKSINPQNGSMSGNKSIFNKSNFISLLLQEPLSKWQTCILEMHSGESFNIIQFLSLIKIFSGIINENDQEINVMLGDIIKSSILVFLNISIRLAGYSDQNENTEEKNILKVLKDSIYDLFKIVITVDSFEFITFEILHVIIEDYAKSDPSIRFINVFDCIIAFLVNFDKNKTDIEIISNLIPCVIENIIIPTGEFLISSNYCDFFELDEKLFLLIQTLIKTSLKNFLVVDEHFLVVAFRLVEWGIKRSNPEIVSMVISCVIQIISEPSEQFSHLFVELFYVPLMTSLIESIIFQSDEHLFENFCQVLNLMFKFAPKASDSPETLASYICNRIYGIINQLDKSRVFEYTICLIFECPNYQKFRTILHDFLVELDHGSLITEELEENEDGSIEESSNTQIISSHYFHIPQNTMINC
ncbi:hypothetical protein TRFO_20008 [Tritrichomonas foetus]|uniref:Importin N-terminal domain-containing protein n=1 Tax=Tritrichomonas foetus TaxID=1144522 RepID=A0A1J4KLN9_9EUKA|nr:hypothetical protein TRFO_20008 [Tritrichomonas foetus]|eukprot:OHT10606.1 hypothetical protein TRFO_20008 [Tritrichomonas foetus]